MANPVSFGDIVYIEFDNLILFGNQIFDPTLYLASPQNIAQKSFRNGLFRLYPNFSYKDTHQVEQLKDQLELLKSLNPSETFAAQQLEKDIQNEKKILEERENRLEGLNKKMYEESKGQPIIYGHKVQLLHLESQCFVSLSEVFNKEGSTLNLELSKEGSKRLYFTFMPKLAFNQEGQVVEYDTPVKLVSCKTDTFLTKGIEVDMTRINTVLNPITNQMCNGDDYPKINPRRKEPIYQVEKLYQTGMSLKEVPENTYLRKFVTIKDDEKASAEKALKNGDYIRISNDKHFLYFIQQREGTPAGTFFQSFRANYDYKYNNLFTLFQIQEVDDDEVTTEDGNSQNQSNPNKLPEGKILEHNENKKYILKHVVSGQYVALKDGKLTLLDPSNAKGEEKFSFVKRGASKSTNNQIDRNSILQFKFHDAAAKEDKFICIGQPLKIPNVQLEMNTLFFFGFHNTQNYLNKWLRVERFNTNVLPLADEEFSSFKLMKVSEEEFASISMVESFTNHLQRLYDMFDAFFSDPPKKEEKNLEEKKPEEKIADEKPEENKNDPPAEKPVIPPVTLKEINETLKKLDEICLKYSQEMYETEYNEDAEDILVPHTLRQTLLREFRTYDLMYQLMNHVASDDYSKKFFEKRVPKLAQKDKPQENPEKGENLEISPEIKPEGDMIAVPDKSSPVSKAMSMVLDENSEFNFANFIQLVRRFKKIILVSFKKNNLNHYYCSQYARVPIRGIVLMNEGSMAYSDLKEQMIAKEMFLELAEELLWDMDLDALGQFNFYETEYFDCVEQQKDYYSVYLKLLNHISNSKAPNLQNLIRDAFVFKFLSKTANFNHVFPEIVEENDKIYLQFKRKKAKENDVKICLNDLIQESSPKVEEKNAHDTDLLMTYFQNALELICGLSTTQSKSYELKIIQYYDYSKLTKLLNLLKSSTRYPEIKTIIVDLIANVHQQYFAMPYVQLPKQLQILGPEGCRNEIDKTIQNATKTIISETELNYIKEEYETENEVMILKTIMNSEEQTLEVLKLMDSNPTMDKPELARVVLDGIKKVFESPVDLEYSFLKKARETVIKLIKQAVEKNTKVSYDFIKYALEVFKQMQTKTLVFAAAEITEILKNKYSSAPRPKGKNDYEKASRANSDYIDFPSNQNEFLEEDAQEFAKLTSKKVTPLEVKNKELSTRERPKDILMPNVIEALAKKWKTGERFFYGNDHKIHRFNQVDIMNKKINTSEALTMLLDIVTLKQDHLLSDVIQQLKKVASFESSLYSELDKLIILQDEENIKKINEVIKITFRLFEISREVNFCQDNLIEIKPERYDLMIAEIYEYHWKLFFIIYDVSKHFRYPDPEIHPEKRFRDAYEIQKNIRWDYFVKLVPEGINRTFQKIFNILKTYDCLIKTQHWLLNKTHSFDEKYQLSFKNLRLNYLLLAAFVFKNKENQHLFSNNKGIIRQYYNQHYMNQSPDALFCFPETLRDNKKLLKLPAKYQYDITLSSYVGTIVRAVSNTSTNGYLGATLTCYHYLCRALIPIELFNPLSDLKTKWGQAANVNSFTKLNLLTYTGEYLPYGYFEVRELMIASLDNFDYLASNAKALNEIQSYLSFQKWLEFFPCENYLLQFELKNYLCKCISKFYFEHESKIRLIENGENCLALVSCLAAEIIFFREYMAKKKGQNISGLLKLSQTSNFITSHPKYIAIKDLYVKANEIDFEQKKLNIYLEEISLHNLIREYIYDGCLDLFFNILLKEVAHCKEIQDANHEIQTIIAFGLELIEEVLNFEDGDVIFPYSKFERFLNKASITKGYFPYRSKIIDLTNKFQSKTKFAGKTIQVAQTGSKIQQVGSVADNFSNYLNPLSNFRKENKEQNMKQVAEHIAEHPKAKEIIREIIKYFKRDVNKLEHDEIVFILRLLRKYIEIENTNNPGDEPLYMWKEIPHSDLKKIEKTQYQYRELGVSEILYSFFTINDQRIFREAILLSLAYMYGGNKDVQLDFLENFTQDDDNKVLFQIGTQLKSCYEFFRLKENKRINVLYTSTQKALFDYLKGKQLEVEVETEELQMRINKLNIDPKHLVPAEKNYENELFILILTFLQVLCEGQYRDLQLYLREQKADDNVHPKSVDFLSFLRHSMNSYYKVLSRYNLKVGAKIMDVIIELVQGEVHENIAVFLHKTFIYDLCRVLTDFNSRYHTLPRGFGLNIFHENFGEFKSKIIFLFKTMLENKNEKNSKTLTEHLDKVGLMRALENLMSEFVRRNNLQKKITRVDSFIFSLNNEDFKNILGDAINIYIIFRYIYSDPNDFNERMRELIKEMDKDKQDFLDKIIFTIFRKLVKSIEIVVNTKEEPLMRIWFPVIAMCHYLHKDTQTQFVKYVDRSNSQTKISSLIDSSQEFLPQMETDYQARNRIFGFNLLNVYYFLRFLSNIAAIIITIINVATFRIEDDDTYQDNSYSKATLGMNIAQIVFAGTLVLLWVALLRKRNQTVEWERFVDQNIKKNGFLPPTLKNKLENGDYKDLSRDECKLILTLKGANSEEFKEMKRSSTNFNQIALRYYIIESYFAIASKEFFWHVCYLGIAIGSLFHPLVAVFQILDVAFRVDTIKQIYSSISRNATQFLWTLFLLVLTNVIYSFIGFFFMNDKFVSEDDLLCETAFSCFLNVLNLGLRSGGGIADVIGSQPYLPGDIGVFIGRVIFDLTFFIIMIILLLNLIFGMIIDAFGDLRDQKTSNEEDEKNVCFICGIERPEFEKHMNFEEHVLEEHNIWSYVYYISYLVEKQRTTKNEMTDIENFVIEKYMVSNYEWIPVGKSLTLENIYQQERIEKEDGIESMKSTLGNIQNNISELNTKNEKFRNILINELKGGLMQIEMKMNKIVQKK